MISGNLSAAEPALDWIQLDAFSCPPAPSLLAVTGLPVGPCPHALALPAPARDL
jgi:hypothetical protein